MGAAGRAWRGWARIDVAGQARRVLLGQDGTGQGSARQARQGVARSGEVSHGRQGMVRLDGAWTGTAGRARPGWTRRGRLGAARRGKARQGTPFPSPPGNRVGGIMRYASVCDGIGAVHLAWKPLGWQCAWTSEIESFPARVVEHHHKLPNLGDMTKITESDIERYGSIDLLVGGTPCQSFSVAGLRKGLADPRGNLALVFLRLAEATRARWVVWENVPGVLSTNGGRDFGSFLGALAELGYGWAYRVLDAQYFGVAQRRRRVFVVGHSGGCWKRAAKVLLEREGPSIFKQERAKETSPCLTAKSGRRFNDGDVIVAEEGGPRWLTPVEHERIQGFPDDYTLIPDAKDTPRYKALGNSMAVPVMRWIGERIQKVDTP